MARIHSHRHGKSHQTRPIGTKPPGWVKQGAEEVNSVIIKLAKEGLTPSKIGVMLRDEHGVPLTKRVVGKSLGKVLAEAKMLPKIPEDLGNLVEKARRVQKHLEGHKSDRKNVRSLELVEAKIYRLSKYYKRMGVLPSDFKYANVVAQVS